MRLPRTLLMIGCAAAVLAASGCAPTKVKFDVNEHAQYNDDYSYARNLARLQRMSRALEDTRVPQDMVSDWGIVGVGTHILVDNYFFNVLPARPGNFGFGAGLQIINYLLAPPKTGTYDTLCAFAPVTAAKTEADAQDLIVRELALNIKKTAEEKGFELFDYSTGPLYMDGSGKLCKREDAWQVIGSTYLVNEALGCKKEKPDRCLFGVRLEKNTEPQLQPAPVPAWVDPQQPLAWFIPDIIAVSKWDGVDVPKRDDIRREWLTAWAKHFPKNTFMYVSPSQKDGKPFPPFYTDGKKAYFFVIPKEE